VSRPGICAGLCAAVVLAGCGGESPVAPAATVNLPVCEEPGPYPEVRNPNLYKEPPCPSAADIEALRRDIPITFADVPWSPIVCNRGEGSVELTWLEERLYQSLIFMRTVRFSQPLPAEWTRGRSLYDWFREAIRGIVVEAGNRSYCCSPDKVIHIATGNTSAVLEWRRTVDTLTLPVLVHEARHADTGVPHTCPTNQTKDARVNDMGAYGVQYWLMFWIAEYSDQPPETRDWYRYNYKMIRLTSFCLECANAR
jgi:hypothetical protein